MATITNVQHLKAFIDGVNLWAPFTKDKKTFDHKKLSQGDIDTLLEKVENELSPENLCCDGELRGRTLKLKTDKLVGAKAQLIKLSK